MFRAMAIWLATNDLKPNELATIYADHINHSRPREGKRVKSKSPSKYLIKLSAKENTKVREVSGQLKLASVFMARPLKHS